MNVLVVPMFALSRMSGPWSRAQAIAGAFEQAGHHVLLGVSRDGNCQNSCVSETLELPVPSPLGLPMALASRTFPLSEKLGISGRKPVRSFEEVLWLTGALSYAYERRSVSAIVDAIVEKHIDVVYSEFSLPAIMAARAVGIPVFGSFSYTTQVSFACNPEKAGGIRKLIGELGLPEVESSLNLFGWLDHRFVPSCRSLEPIDDPNTQFVGFVKHPSIAPTAKRDCVVIYLGSGSVPDGTIERAVVGAFSNTDIDVFVAGAHKQHERGNIHFSPRFDFSELLPRARCFVHHGGQNSTMDALAYETPQVIVPGRIFERIYNAQSIERAGAGIMLDRFTAKDLAEAVRRMDEDSSFTHAAKSLRAELASLGGANAIVRRVEENLMERFAR
ncbi:MAG: glycosyltransferase family 1 protein [Eggerthellaceae bacterium]|nr:glycosyltransferase family 1 protein [Eggerthellaceae bacterium]